MATKKAKNAFQMGVDFLVGDGIENLKSKKRTTAAPGGQAKSSAPPINPLNMPGGIARAARLLLTLGPDQAAAILRELDQGEIEALVNEMAKIPQVSAAEKDEILADFEAMVKREGETIRGGVQKTQEILSSSLGREKAEEIMSRLHRQNLEQDFEFLEKIEPPLLAAVIAEEHPQVIAVALSCMKPRIAALILKNLSPELRSDVSIRIARTSRTHPEAVQRVAQVLREKFEKRRAEIYSDAGGTDVLANIMNHLDRSTEDDLLKKLDDEASDVYNDVKELLYTFEELANLELREMRLLLSTVNDDFILASALRGVGEEYRRHFFNALSQNRAADILEEMNRRGALSVREINEARSFVLTQARRLDDQGEIVIKKEREEFI